MPLRFCRALSTLHTSTADRGHKTLYAGPLPARAPAMREKDRGRERETEGEQKEPPSHCVRHYTAVCTPTADECVCTHTRQTICSASESLVWESVSLSRPRPSCCCCRRCNNANACRRCHTSPKSNERERDPLLLSSHLVAPKEITRLYGRLFGIIYPLCVHSFETFSFRN